VKLSIREAFSLEPVLTVNVGGRDYQVPPLTFGRLDELIKAQKSTDLAALDTGAFLERIKDGTSPEAVGKALAHFPTEAFAPSAAAVIPGMTTEEWEKNGTPYVFFDLLKFFTGTHDWPYISESLFAKSDADESASDIDLQTAILLMARELGCRIDEPLGFRAEGFFLAVEAIRGKRNAQEAARERAEREAEGWDGPPCRCRRARRKGARRTGQHQPAHRGSRSAQGAGGGRWLTRLA
jgi:hypothetical protein